MTNQVYKALCLAIQAHDGQYDKAGKPYMLHPLYLFSKFSDEEEICQIVSLLHDVVEDSIYTLDDLIQIGFGYKVMQAVNAITKRKDENEDYLNYINRVIENPYAIKVKIEDLKHNMDLNRLQILTEKDNIRNRKYKESLLYLEGVLGRV